MRRVALAIAGTVAGLVVLLTFKSHTGTSAVSAAPAGTAGPGGSAGTSSRAGTTNGAGGTAARARPAGPVAAGLPRLAAAHHPGRPRVRVTPQARIITGNVANTIYGPVQIQAAVNAGKIIKVTILQQPSTTAHDLQIGVFAFPQLEAETLSAQSAKIDMVSGATYTSGGYIQSLQSAIDRGA